MWNGSDRMLPPSAVPVIKAKGLEPVVFRVLFGRRQLLETEPENGGDDARAKQHAFLPELGQRAA
jgi:hypothetical protein